MSDEIITTVGVPVGVQVDLAHEIHTCTGSPRVTGCTKRRGKTEKRVATLGGAGEIEFV